MEENDSRNRPLTAYRRYAPGIATCLALYFLLPLLGRPPFFTGTDFFAWGSDWGWFSRCLSGEAAACARLSKFPLGYLLNSAFVEGLKPMGFGPEQSLSLANALFLALPILFLFVARGAAYARVAGALYLLAVLATPIPPFYVYSGALEVQSGVALGIFLASALLVYEGRIGSPTVGFWAFFLGSAFLFPWYKDTNLAVVVAGLAIGLGLARRRSPGLVPRSFTVPILLAVGGSLALALSYNWVKYQTLLPHSYLLERARTSPSAARSLEFLAAGILSPNGGALIFWAFAFFVTSAGAKVTGLGFSRLALLCATVVGAGFLLANSLWWAPFGWLSWGDRLLVPAGLGCLIFLLGTGNFLPELPPGRKLSRRALAIALPLAGLSFYYVSLSYLADREGTYKSSLDGPACDRMLSAMRAMDPKPTIEFWRSDFYYRCAGERFSRFPHPAGSGSAAP